MPTTEYLRHLLGQAAPMLELEHIAYRQERDACLVAFDAQTMFDLEYDQEVNRIVIAGGIWELPDDARLCVYEILLQYNYLWMETGGVRMALDGMPGQVVMMFDLSTTGLSASRLGSVLSNLATIQRAWRRMLQDTFSGHATAGKSYPTPDLASALIMLTP